MSKRNYNVFFNTHTVSGIVISVALYVIFFAGAFALFKDEIKIWEDGKKTHHVQRTDVDYDKLLRKISEKYELKSRDVQLNLGHHNPDDIYVILSAAKDSTITNKEVLKRDYFSINIHSGAIKSYEENYSLGEFLYRLHFFTQIPTIGIYLAGFVSLFFLFAIVTGIIVHWKKIVTNFYQFNPKTTLKRVWTDAHTALGVIGLPFQFIYAITGAYFCLSLLVLIPANFLYNNNQDKLMEAVRPERYAAPWISETSENLPSLNNFVKTNTKQWSNFHPDQLFLNNYKGVNTSYKLVGGLADEQQFLSTGFVSYDLSTNKTIVKLNPNELNYTSDIQQTMTRLHFGDYGGLSMKIIYFVLALITCFVIITGVLIWIEARNKKSMTLKQRFYTAKVGHIYMAICLSLFPVIALFFVIVKLLPPAYQTQKMSILYTWFFIVWLIVTIALRYKRDNYFINKITLLSGAFFGFLIPIVNGIISGNWIWMTYQNHQYEILTIDLLWIALASAALFIYLKIKPTVKEQSAFSKHPIDYINRKTLLAEEAAQLKPKLNTTQLLTNDKNHIPMRTKIVILWIFLGIGWLVHHLYGLFNIYYNETLIMEGATGEAPLIHHIYRILFEGLCLFFGLLTLEVSKKWFKITALVWASIAGLYNIYHFFEAIIHESGNISEIFMLLLVSIASIFLIKNLYHWIKD